jgi:peptidoglycan L-alanyl-D-glutamate endopeptidase CwlK
MRYILGRRSKGELATCCDDIQNVIRLYMEWQLMDCTVVEGHRDKATQNKYFAENKSRIKFPKGKHNTQPSNAVDIAPYINGAISWKRVHCIYLAGGLVSAGRCLGINIRWGGNWDMDGEPITDQNFQDLVHFEVIN